MLDLLIIVGTTIAVAWVTWTLIFENLYIEHRAVLRRRRAAARNAPEDGVTKK